MLLGDISFKGSYLVGKRQIIFPENWNDQEDSDGVARQQVKFTLDNEWSLN